MVAARPRTMVSGWRVSEHHPRRVLVLPAKTFPTTHPMLTEILARRLPARGYEVSMIMRTEEPISSDATWLGSRVVLVRSAAGPVQLVASSVRFLRAVIDESRTFRPDVILVRNSVGSGLLAMLLRRGRTAYVHQVSFPVLESRIARAARLGRGWGLRASAARTAVFVRQRLLQRADLVLAISDEMRRRLVGSGVRGERVVVLPLGADPPEAVSPEEVRPARRRHGIEDDHELVLYAGSVAPARQLGVLIGAAAALRASHPQAHWLVVGPATEREDDRLRQAAERAGVGDRFTVRGSEPRAQISLLLAGASVAMSPVPMTEDYAVASPTKTIEALAAGCPVVASPIPDQADVLRASGGGILAPPTPDAIAEAVGQLLSDPDAAKVMGRSGQRWVIEHRSWDVLTDRLERSIANLRRA